jgi:hypothetical protein
MIQTSAWEEEMAHTRKGIQKSKTTQSQKAGRLIPSLVFYVFSLSNWSIMYSPSSGNTTYNLYPLLHVSDEILV